MATVSAGSAAALDALQASLNDIFLHIGSVFNSSVTKTTRNNARAGARMKQAIPAAVNRFHDALDDLETELVQAKTLLMRDLNELRQEKEAAARAAAEADASAKAADQKGAPTGDAGDGQKADDNDLEMVDFEEAKPADAEAEQLASGDFQATEHGDTTTQAEASQNIARTKEGQAIGKRDDTGDGEQGKTNGTDTQAATGDASKQKEEEEAKKASPAGDDNDISSLLPGLASYANNQGDDDMGMDLFGGQQDSFDDLFDFTREGEETQPLNFDMSEFDDQYFNI